MTSHSLDMVVWLGKVTLERLGAGFAIPSADSYGDECRREYLPLEFAPALSTTAVVSLLPPERSGIAHVMAQLISHPDWRLDVYAPAFSSELQTNVPILS